MEVKAAIIKPIKSIDADRNFKRYLADAFLKEIFSPFISVTIIPKAILPSVAFFLELSKSEK